MLTPREAFKAGFLARCAQLGMTQDEIVTSVKSASALLKESEGSILGSLASTAGNAASAVGNTAKTVGSLGLAGALLLPPAVGAATGYGLGRLTDISDDDVDTIKQQELIDEYLRNAERLRHRNHSYQSLKRVRPGRRM